MPRDLDELRRRPAKDFQAADELSQANITVVIFTSPVPSHPTDWLLANVYESIRVHLPKSRILVLADGVEGDEPTSYVEFKSRIRQRGWELLEFKGRHYHTLMLREALLNHIETPLIMVGEHDWGIRRLYVDWRSVNDVLLDPVGRFKLIQIRQATVAGWEYAFFSEVVRQHGINLLPTICFQGPMHVANCDWYRRIVPFLDRPQNLEGSDLTFFLHQGDADKNNLVNGLHVTKSINQMAGYIPDGPMGRLYHLNGRDVISPDELRGIGNL